jgi:ribose-phosphate pyrophosphokinase
MNNNKFEHINTIELDPYFRPYREKYTSWGFDSFRFHGGESHIKLERVNLLWSVDKIIITQRIKNSDDLMLILLAKDAFERAGIKKFELVIPYVPYARQDRQCAPGESFSLKVFAEIINAQNFEKVTVLDAHSDVAPALLNNSVNISNKKYVNKAVDSINSQFPDEKPILISPDAGSNKKCNALMSDAFDSLVKCDKIRDLDTGKLSGFQVFADDLQGKPCLIVDDICDGGGTFMGVAEELKKKNAGPIFLFVTHGIFSKGLSGLAQVFTGIYTTNSFSTIDSNEAERTSLTQFNIKLK